MDNPDEYRIEARRESYKKYYEKNKERINQYHREKYAQNREELRKKALARYYARKEASGDKVGKNKGADGKPKKLDVGCVSSVSDRT